ncbi:MAG: two pore domain potassium channel family protein [Deltaproteobacteria bacterium]|nr:two pore domain potassium channel family protein [Deltaproteobacteria bacterium]
MRNLVRTIVRIWLGPPIGARIKQGGYSTEYLQRAWREPSYGLLRLTRLVVPVVSWFQTTPLIDQPLIWAERAVNVFRSRLRYPLVDWSKQKRCVGGWRDCLHVLRIVFLFGTLIGWWWDPRWMDYFIGYLIADMVVACTGGVLVWSEDSLNPDRTLLRGLLNFGEGIVGFASLYLYCNCLTTSCQSGKLVPITPGEALYFSAVTAATLGYGDFVPLRSGPGYTLVVSQLAVSFLFVAFFLSAFVSAASKDGGKDGSSR